jgi:REP element-mobilizing transposase RayT
MRPLRELRQDVWYEIRTAVNNRGKLFRLRQNISLFTRVLGETAERFKFEIRALRMEGEWLAFYVKPDNGFQLPAIMQWLKQTFAVRHNVRHGNIGHVWGDRYWSRILEGEPPDGAERWDGGAVMGVEAAELLPAETGDSPPLGETEVKGRPLLRESKGRVCPVPKKPAEIPRRAVLSPR